MIEPREALARFAADMEAKLRKNDHKKDWRELPVAALLRLLEIELEELKVALEYLPVSESRKESVDLANFAMFIWDRLSLLEQDKKISEQHKGTGL